MGAKDLFVSFAPEQVLDENGQTLYAANGMLVSLLLGVLIGTIDLPSLSPLGPFLGLYTVFAGLYAVQGIYAAGGNGIYADGKTVWDWDTITDQLATFAPKRVLGENGQTLYAVNGTVPSLLVVVLIGGTLLNTGSFALDIIGFVLFCRAFRGLLE